MSRCGERRQDPPGEAKLDWEIISLIAKEMGYGDKFAWKSAEEIFNEMAALTPSYAGMTYERLQKPEALHWPCPTKEHPGTPILHGEKFGMPDGKGLMTAISFKYAQTERPDAEYPHSTDYRTLYLALAYRNHDQEIPDLEREESTGWIEISDEDAKALGIKNGEFIKAISRRGEIRNHRPCH